NSSSFFSTQIPAGVHSIKWTAEDGCGNITVCEYLFTVEDCDGPTVYALNGIAVDLGQADQADVWATDLDQGSYDNCSGICDYRIGVPSGGPGQTAPPTTDNYVFDCDDIAAYGSNIPVDLWVKDCADNWSYVSTYVLVEDNAGVCDGNNPQTAVVTGTIATESTESVESVEIAVTGNAPGLPSSVYTNNAGAYNTIGLPFGYNYEVTPSLNLDPLNGVSTYDLVLISKHILGITALDSPYKQIAADVNKSGSITTFDMVELRKLILFIDTEFQNNESWRFVEADFVFDNANNPWATVFPEMTAINNLTANEIADYVGIKVGDVNGSAIPNSLVGSEDRTTVDDLVFNLDNQKMVAGEEYTVNFKANDFNNIMGYQFTMSFDTDAVEFVDMTAGNLTQLSEGNFGLNKVEEGVITTSWNNTEATAMSNDDVVFTVTFRAKSATQLSDVLAVNSRYTAAEAYNAELELMGVAVEYNNENGAVATAGFDLYQNTPNPFKAETVIGFNLPQAGNASLKVYDVAGRVLRTVEVEGNKGYNEVTLNRSDLSGTGVMYYTLETATDSATKKMIIVD
ncbi:MAG: cohesin domain-containing protein, partial [Saprospiraceae bacterium]